MSDNFGTYIKQIRISNGLPLRKLAADLDIDQSTLCKIENGQRKLKEKLLPRLAKVLKINEKTLKIKYLGSQIAYSLLEEKNALEVLKVAEETLTQYISEK
ncbi:helix-turn-helix transcriptional regulator [Chitinispirillales bacterium ANBcel5]|uniref:helix-turn-helix domain-containing protein n=1 Tax=Cellulosispirillum alkaliphilum TaxID=3039283 RepID=UPI002A51DE3C|nr:helix-turn-helix transcriptional regulator [Chitinispirillales bacterium ANBcel5]